MAELCIHQRYGNDHDADAVDDDKSADAVHAGDVRKTPDVSEADGVANGGEQERTSGCPRFVPELAIAGILHRQPIVSAS